jgi:hypothetical protein
MFTSAGAGAGTTACVLGTAATGWGGSELAQAPRVKAASASALKLTLDNVGLDEVIAGLSRRARTHPGY